MKIIYQYEVGVLLDKTHPEYTAYSNVWDKKHGFYNEDSGIMFDYAEVIEYVADYVNKGVKNTYGIISKLNISDEEYEDLIQGIYNDNDMDYSWSKVVKFYINKK